jgi:hypothetical protein
MNHGMFARATNRPTKLSFALLQLWMLAALIAILSALIPVAQPALANEIPKIVLSSQVLIDGSIRSSLLHDLPTGKPAVLRLTYECTGSVGEQCDNLQVVATVPSTNFEVVSTSDDLNTQSITVTDDVVGGLPVKRVVWSLGSQTLGTTGQVELSVRFKPGVVVPNTTDTVTTSIQASNVPLPPLPLLTNFRAIAADLSDPQPTKTIRYAGTVDADTTYRIRHCASTGEIGALRLETVTITDTLPLNAQYVGANPQPFSVSGNTVVWKLPVVDAGGCASVDVRVRFPDASFNEGDSVNNNVSLSYTYPGNVGSFVIKSNNLISTIPGPTPGLSAAKSGTLEAIEGDTVTNILSVENSGNTVMSDVTIIDTIPNPLLVTGVRPGIARQVQYQVDGVNVWYTVPVTATTMSVPNPTHWPALGSGYISKLRFSLGDLPVGFQNDSIQITSVVRSGVGPEAGPGPATRPVVSLSNTAIYTATVNGTPFSVNASSPGETPTQRARPFPSKQTVPDTAVLPGKPNVQMEAKISNPGFNTLEEPVLVDLLPVGLSYVPGSYELVTTAGQLPADSACAAISPANFSATLNWNSTGRTLLKLDTTGTGCTIDRNESLSFRFKVDVSLGVPTGNLGNRLVLVDSSNVYTGTNPTIENRPFYCTNTRTPVEASVTNLVNTLVAGGFTASQLCVSEKGGPTIRAVASLRSEKQVKGQLDNQFHRDPKVGQTIQGGAITYSMVVTNTGSVAVDQINIFDILAYYDPNAVPFSNIGTRDGELLGTTWTPRLTGPITITSATGESLPVTIYYSPDENPCREVGEGVELVELTCTPMDLLPSPTFREGAWSTQLPVNPERVRSVRLEFAPDYRIEPGAALRFRFEMFAPDNAPVSLPGANGVFGDKDDLNVAWNTFAYTVRRTDDGGRLIAQPPRVGVTVRPSTGTNYSLGDYIWFDRNANGRQDADEEGLNGVTLQLYNADTGQLIRQRVTTNDVNGSPGSYTFPELPAGNYQVKIVPPPGYLLTTLDSGVAIDTTDSDFDLTTFFSPIITLNDTQTPPPDRRNPTIDGGLIADPVSIGNRVFYDTNNDGIDNDGTGNVRGSSTGISNVAVELYYDIDRNGYLSENERANPIAQQTTDPQGYYLFTRQTLANGTPLPTPLPLLPGRYWVGLPASNFNSTGPLLGYYSSQTFLSPQYSPEFYGQTGRIELEMTDEFLPRDPNLPITGTETYNFFDKGERRVLSDTQRLAYVRSLPVDLLDDEPNSEQADLPGSFSNTTPSGTPIADNRSNQTIDFGFYTQQLGSLVWRDNGLNGNFNDGIKSADENGIAGVPVALRTRLFGNMFVDVNFGRDGVLGTADDSWGPDGVKNTTDDTVATNVLTTTLGTGEYRFLGLPQGQYFAQIVAPAGLFSSQDVNGDTDTPNAGVDQRDNGVGIANGTIQTNFFTMNPGSGAGTAITPTLGLSYNPTIDFGLIPHFAVGNTVWADIDNDGLYEPNGNDNIANNADDEKPLGGVTMELYKLNASGAIDTSFTTLITTTNANGFYLFTDLLRGEYQVVIPASQFTGSGPLVGYANSTGTPDTNLDVDNNDDGQPGTGSLNGAVVSAKVTLTDRDLTTGAASTEPTGENPVGLSDPLPDNQSNQTVDFGFYRISVGNLVWHDYNNNGIRDSGEAGLNNVRLELRTITDTLVAVVNTDANGAYLFNQQTSSGATPNGKPILPGDYYISIPANQFASSGQLYNFLSSAGVFTASLNLDNRDDGAPVGVTETTNGVRSGVFTLTPGAPGANNLNSRDYAAGNTLDPTIDFGFHTMSIGNRVWRDDNNNGLLDAGEPGLNGLTVRLYNDANSDGLPDSTAIMTTTTASNSSNAGYYIFRGLRPGSYLVEVTLPNGYISSTGSGLPFAPTGTYEPGRSEASAASDDSKDNGTQGDGTTFAVNLVRSKTITLVAAGEPTSENGTAPTGATNRATDSNSQFTVDFGLYPLLSLGNRVWDDTNNNGSIDGGENGIPGVLVKLYYDANNNGSLTGTETTPISTTTTTTDGLYIFSRLRPGQYQVELATTNFTSTGTLVGYASSTGRGTTYTHEPGVNADTNNGDTDDNGTLVGPRTISGAAAAGASIRSSFVVLSVAGEPTGETPDNRPVDTPDNNANLTVDFGVFQPAALGDYIWSDEDRQGDQDASEVGINGVQVTLYDAAGTTIISRTVTANDPNTPGRQGYYHFANLLPNTSYQVRIDSSNFAANAVLANYRLTARDATGDTNDSDAQFQGGIPVIVAASTGAANTDTPTYDAGFYPIAALGDYVWHDVNANGIQDDGAVNGINGVTVRLYDATGLVSETLTINDSGGQPGYYRFNNLFPNRAYTITLNRLSDFQAGGPLVGYRLSPANATVDTQDSDATLVAGYPTITRTTGGVGSYDPSNDYGFYIPRDRGDLPDSSVPASVVNSAPYNTDNTGTAGPSHVITATLRIGASVDDEPNGQPNSTATGDGSDEDGVTLPTQIIAGRSTTFSVSVFNTYGETAYLRVFVDWNGDGAVNPLTELQTITVNSIGNSSAAVNFTVPVDADTSKNLGARFRLSTDMGLTADGSAPNGEVEDYLIRVLPLDRGDLPDTSAGSGLGDYQTTISNGGPNHPIVNGLRLGATIDGETNGQPNATATGDGSDEDGVSLPAQIIAGRPITVPVQVVNPTAGTSYVHAFIDWNGNGTFDGGNEYQRVAVGANITQTLQLAWNVPANAATNVNLGARFRLSSDSNLDANGDASNGEVEDYLLRVTPVDWGDLPEPRYSTDRTGTEGPSHPITSTLRLGATLDGEADGQPNSTATGDGSDEDGIAMPATAMIGTQITLPFTVTNTTGANATLAFFIDWNGDGDFDDSVETTRRTITSAAGSQTLSQSFNLPTNVTPGAIGARFRLSNDANLGPNGPASNGEVEDYLLELVPATDRGDLPDSGVGTGAGNYQTTTSDNGPSHTIVPGLLLGTEIDAETNGQPDTSATGDDTAGFIPADEDGLGFPPLFVAGRSEAVFVEVTNTTSTTSTLYAFVDWNNDGRFDGLNEIVTTTVPANFTGARELTLTAPITATTSTDLGLRLRLSSEANLGPNGPASDGEVEDYLVQVLPVDWGDLPEGVSGLPSYNTDRTGIAGASHPIISELRLGATIDGETDGQPNATATGDGNDEDGVTLPNLSLIRRGANPTFVVTATNTLLSDAYIHLFVDWDGDGLFTGVNERETVEVLPGSVNTVFNVVTTVPTTATISSNIGVRVRYSTDATLDANGPASDGEVEDYMIRIAVDRGDLPDGNQSGSPSYATLDTNNGPAHPIINGLQLGTRIDAEADGQPNSTASGDGNDEDGVTIPPQIIAGRSVSFPINLTNTTGQPAFVHAFVDWNGNGLFTDADEQTTIPVTTGTNTLTMTVPIAATIDQLIGARFRLSTDAVLLSTGTASNGEVEDYLIQVVPTYSLGNRVWFDLNNNGSFDAGETGSVGVVLGLERDTGSGFATVLNGSQPLTVTTDANGYYRFDDLLAGEYRVVVRSENFGSAAVLNGYRSSNDPATASDVAADQDDNGTGSFANPVVVSLPVTLGPGNNQPTTESDLPGSYGTGATTGELAPNERNNLAIDFGFYRLSIGSQLWIDGDANTTFDSSDTTPSAVQGLTVELRLANSPTTVVARTTTNATGVYTFTTTLGGEPLAEGGYIVVVPTIPNGYVPLQRGDQLTDNHNQGALVSGLFSSQPFTLTAGINAGSLPKGTLGQLTSATTGETSQPTLDFGLQPVYSLGNRVWFDLNKDGYFDTGEIGAPGVVLGLFKRDVRGDFTQVLSGTQPLTVTTDANGYYRFDELLTGEYVVEVLASNFNAGQPLAGAFSSRDPETSFSESVDRDDNGVGVLADSLTGIRSRSVQLGAGSSEPISEEQPGSYGAGAFSGNAAVQDEYHNLTIDFGFYRVQIGNQIWLDGDRNTTFDAADSTPPTVVGNLTVELRTSDNIVVARTTSDSTGVYTFTTTLNGDPIPADSYYVAVPNLPIGYTTVATGTLLTDNHNQAQIVNGELRTPLFSFEPGASLPGQTLDAVRGLTSQPTLDLGLQPSFSLGNRVWFDTNNNRTIDLGEGGVSGVTLELYRDDGNGSYDANDRLIGSTTTISNGYYLFDRLPPGDYLVVVPGTNFDAGRVLNGYFSSGTSVVSGTLTEVVPANPNDQPALDSDDNGSATTARSVASAVLTLGPEATEPSDEIDATVGISDTATNDRSNLTLDFGFYRAALQSVVWRDTNNSGTFDSGESGIPGVTVELYSVGSNTPFATATTNSVGVFSFASLPQGSYTLRLPASNFQPTSVLSGTASSTGDGVNGSNQGNPYEPGADPQNGVPADDNGSQVGTPGDATSSIATGIFNLTPGAGAGATINNPTGSTLLEQIDFGVWPAPQLSSERYSLGNRVWFDANNNGLLDAEPGIGGVTLQLLASDGQPFDRDPFTAGTQPVTTTTDTNGYYRFDDLPPGAYIVEVTVPNGHRSSSVGEETDPNSDGDRNDNGVVSGANTVRSGVVALGPSEPSGETDLGNGDQAQPDARTNLTVDFGFFRPLALGNLVFDDRNNNGRFEGDDQPLAGATVTLVQSNGIPAVDVNGTPVAPQVTSNDGRYRFENLPPGSYQVVVTPPSGYRSSTGVAANATGPFEPAPSAGNAVDNDDNGSANGAQVVSSVVTLISGAAPTTDGDNDANTDLTVDFGLFRPASLGNVVWFDTNGNGQKDANETGVANITVTLYDQAGTAIATVTTDSTGSYRFDNLPAGSYSVGFSNLPNGMIFTTPNQGSDGSDSDVDPTTGRTGLVTLVPGQEDLTLFAGLVPSSPTAVVLSGFSSGWENGALVVRWQTLAEVNTAGFHLLRSNTGNLADAVRVTNALVLGQGSAGGTYRWVDSSAVVGETYTYWLEEVELDGATNRYGPVRAVPQQIGTRILIPLINR